MPAEAFSVLYPDKCVLCQRLLAENETDLCRSCREKAPEYPKGKFKISFVARWTAIWYYKDDVRESLLRYKFLRRQPYGTVYGRLLAMKLLKSGFADFDVLTWVPISFLRRWKRGFDQSEVLANSVARELGCQAQPVLRKIRHNRRQSRLRSSAKRRANVLGAYRVRDASQIKGKRILLLDDIITSGATVSECAKTLLAAGAKEVICAAVAVADKHD